MAAIGEAVLLLVTIRSLAEIYRLEHSGRARLVEPPGRLFVGGALVAAIAQGLTLAGRVLGRGALVAWIPPAAVTALFAWKVFLSPETSDF